MSEDFNFDAAPAAPTLSFGAEEAKAVQEEPKAEAKNNGNIAMEAQLSAEELKQVEEFSKQIDISNSSGIMNYGVGTQKKLADFSEKALDNVKTKDMGEVGGMITDLVTQLKDFEIAGKDKIFYPAKAQHFWQPGGGYWDEAIKVSSPQVKKPVAVRYCFKNFQIGNVKNGANLPLFPFRTDNW